jgi:hypothetical protein
MDIEEVTKYFEKGTKMYKSYMSFRKWNGKSQNLFMSSKKSIRVDKVCEWKCKRVKKLFYKEHKQAIWIQEWLILANGKVKVRYLQTKGVLNNG